MRKIFVMSFALLAGASGAIAADIEAGKAKVGVVCAACHGALGASVSDTIPNLAGQKSRYIEIQLKAPTGVMLAAVPLRVAPEPKAKSSLPAPPFS